MDIWYAILFVGVGFFCGIVAAELARREVNQIYPSRVNTDGALPTREHLSMTAEQLLDATIEPNRELTRIEKALRVECGVQEYSDEADLIMHAVRDGTNWNDVVAMAHGELPRIAQPPRFVPANRVERWL